MKKLELKQVGIYNKENEIIVSLENQELVKGIEDKELGIIPCELFTTDFYVDDDGNKGLQIFFNTTGDDLDTWDVVDIKDLPMLEERIEKINKKYFSK